MAKNPNRTLQAVSEEFEAKNPTEKEPWSFDDLSEPTLQDLRKSGLSDNTIRDARIIDLVPTERDHLLNREKTDTGKRYLGITRVDNHDFISRRPYLIPYLHTGYDCARAKLLDPLGDTKYLSRSKNLGGRVHAYFPPGEHEKIGKKKTPLIVVEGEKKALKIRQELHNRSEYCVVGLPGAGMWFSCEETRQILLPGREVYLFFDADYHNNDDVQGHLINLYLYLLYKRALPRVVSWQNEGCKGIDDYLVAQDDNEAALSALLGTAEENLLSALCNGNGEIQNKLSTTKKIAQYMARHDYTRARANAFYGQYDGRKYLSVAFSSVVWPMVADSKASAANVSEWVQINDNGRPEVVPGIAARCFVDTQKGKLLYTSGAFWRYLDGAWRIAENLYIETAIQEFLGEKMARKRTIEDLVFQTRNLVAMPQDFDFSASHTLINLRNCTLDISDPARIQARPHRKDDYLTQQFPVDYDPEADFEEWEEFLGGGPRGIWLADETIMRLQEWFGYSLVPATHVQKCLFLKGGGHNGKSKLLDVWARLLGDDATAAVSLDEMFERFKMAELQNKYLNVCAEIDTAKIFSERFKGVICGERQSAERKNHAGFFFRPFAKHVFSANKYMPTKDRTKGFFRRFDIMEFNREIKPEEREARIDERLCKNLSGILNWALTGLKRLLRNNWDMSAAPDMDAAHAKFRIYSSPLEQFIQEKIELEAWKIGDGNFIRVSDFAEQYLQFCLASRYSALSARKLAEEMEGLGYGKKKKRINSGPQWYYEGIGVSANAFL